MEWGLFDKYSVILHSQRGGSCHCGHMLHWCGNLPFEKQNRRRLPPRSTLGHASRAIKTFLMTVFQTTKDLEAALAAAHAEGKSVGLVPTMGALHAGHASLVKRSVAENALTVVSVFVNPTQFNDANDLKNYPRTFDADCELLESLGADFVFAPTVEEVYPEPDTRSFSYPPVDTVMEGGVVPVTSMVFAKL